VDVYFSADVETDGPIPGPYSMLSFALVFAGTFDGKRFQRPEAFNRYYYAELQPISEHFQPEALAINGLDRERLLATGLAPHVAMEEATKWVSTLSEQNNPVLVAYPLSFDWTWLYWYFTQYHPAGSPFGYSNCFDIKTALAVKGHIPIGAAGRSKIPASLGATRRRHTHHAIDDAVEQAEIFANVFEWGGKK
jgi:hypothetical protein